MRSSVASLRPCCPELGVRCEEWGDEYRVTLSAIVMPTGAEKGPLSLLLARMSERLTVVFIPLVALRDGPLITPFFIATYRALDSTIPSNAVLGRMERMELYPTELYMPVTPSYPGGPQSYLHPRPGASVVSSICLPILTLCSWD